MLPTEPPSLRTPRLRLRPIADDDAASFFEIHADPVAMRYWSTPAWTDPERAVHLITVDRVECAAGRSIRFVVIDRADDRTIGFCSLHRIEREQERGEVGYILRRSHWGRGFMREALGAVVAYAFDVLSLRRLEADVDPRNDASGRLLERLGFRCEALMRGRWLVDGEVSDSAIYGLLRGDPRPR